MLVSDWTRLAARGLAMLWLAALCAGSPALAAPGVGPVQACLSQSDQGPCLSPDIVDFFPGPAPVALTNFGMLFPSASGNQWEVTCDDNYELALASRIRRAPDGRLFTASNRGLLFTSDGCTFTGATGAIGIKLVYDVTFDAKNPNRVWALGDLPRKLWVSNDGGKSFVEQQAFADAFTFARVVSAPSDPNRLYLFGRGTQGTTPTVASTDGGQTAVPFDLVARATPAPPSAFDFVAVSPTDPLTVYFSAVHVDGDELWRTTDGGTTVRRLLKLEGMEALSGFTFGADDKILYVAGTSTDIIQAPGQPPARLYISRDGGGSWQPPVPSGAKGPRYKCLAQQGGQLFACGAGELMGDDAMLSSSRDEGKTWTPVVRLDHLGSARSCVKSACVATEMWLCESYQQCAPGLTPPRDAGVIDAPVADAGVAPPPPQKKSSGCSFASTVGGDADPAGVASAVVLVGLLMVGRRRERARGRDRGRVRGRGR